MPVLEESDLHEYAVLWSAGGVDDYGNPTVSAPVEIPCRWLIGMRESLDAEGNIIGVSDTVIVDRAIPIGSILWKGRLKDLPSSPTDLKQVIEYRETPDVKGRKRRRMVLLSRYSDQLPEYT